MTLADALLAPLTFGIPYVVGTLFISSLLSFLIPNSLKEKYLRPPYFTKGEVILLTSFPKRLLLGNHFVFMVAAPKLSKKRGLENAILDAPRWWIAVSYLYFWLGFVPLLIWCVGLFVFWFLSSGG